MPYLHLKGYKYYHKGAELEIEVCSVTKKKKKKKEKKKKKKKKRKEKKRTTKQFRLVSLSAQITWSYSTKYVSGYLKGDANHLRGVTAKVTELLTISRFLHIYVE